MVWGGVSRDHRTPLHVFQGRITAAVCLTGRLDHLVGNWLFYLDAGHNFLVFQEAAIAIITNIKIGLVCDVIIHLAGSLLRVVCCA